MDPQREFRLGDWQITPLRGVLHRDDESRRLTPKSMDVLLRLAQDHGNVVARDVLLADVWAGRAQSDEPLNKCIAEIRRQLGDERGAPKYIETIPKRGYRLIAHYEPIGSELDDSEQLPFVDKSNTKTRNTIFLAAIILVAVLFVREYFDISEQNSQSIAIAVLPFDVVSSGDSKEYFAQGMHEELIASLSKNQSLAVRSRTSTLQYGASNLTLPEIAAALNADVIVDGSVRQEGDKVRVTVQLIDTETDAHLWSENFEQTLTVADLFAIQNKIARAVGAALEITLSSGENQQADELPTESLQAYEHFMLGKYHYRRLLPGDIQSSVENFEAAVALDPGFAAAWDWLAYAYNHAATAVGYLSPSVAYPKARIAALRALEIEPELATSISLLGYIRAVFDWDWVGAERDMRRALQLAPNDSGTVWSLAHVLAMLGRHDEAIAMVVDFANQKPELGRRHFEVVNRLIDAGRYAEAAEWLNRATERGAEQAQVYDAAGIILVGQGDFEGAVDQLEQAVDAGQRASGSVARLLFVYAKTHRDSKALALFAELQERYKKEPFSALTMATAYLGLGDEDRALDYLEAAARDRDRGILSLLSDPFFVALHNYERFKALISQFGIPTDSR